MSTKIDMSDRAVEQEVEAWYRGPLEPSHLELMRGLFYPDQDPPIALVRLLQKALIDLQDAVGGDGDAPSRRLIFERRAALEDISLRLADLTDDLCEASHGRRRLNAP